MMKNIKHKKNKGFSFVEILVVLMIIGILVSLLKPAYYWILTDSKNDKKEIAIQRITAAKTSYYLDNPQDTNVPPLETINGTNGLITYLDNIDLSVGTNAFNNVKGGLFEGCFGTGEKVFLNPRARQTSSSDTNNMPHFEAQ